MKQTIKLVILAAMLALTLPVMAQAQTPAVAAGGCTDDAKAAMYNEFLVNRKGKTPETPNGDQDVAYNAAKKYMTTCPTDDSAQAQYMKKWMASYEVGDRKARFLLAYDKKDFAEMMELGRKVLADDPNYVRGYILLGNLGYLASAAGNTSFNAESMGFAKKAIELLEVGKTPDDWKPYAGKDDALAWMNYSIGQTLKTSPAESLPYFLKAARLEGFFKKNPLTYIAIEQAYENGLYAKQSEDYKQYAGKPETPEQKLALQNIYQTVDRMIDGYARAIALLPGADAKLQPNKPLWTQNLTDWYKFRNNNVETGIPELVASILQKPLPDVPTPLTTLPAPAAGATTPAATPGGATAAPATTGQPANKATTTPKPTTTTPATTQATKPKPKANHSRRHRP